jgi:hypothetical protein
MSSESARRVFTPQDIIGHSHKIKGTIGGFRMTNEKPASPEPDETKTMPVPKAGKIYFGLGRDASYQAAKSGQLPVIWVGGRVRAVVPAIERMLEQAGKKPPRTW